VPETIELSLDPGEQALVSVPSMGSPLSYLPDEAFENLLVASATTSCAKVESLVERRGGDPQKVGVVPITGSDDDYDGPLWTTDPVDPSDLTGISIRLSKAMKYVMRGGWVVFDNVNVLLMYGREEQVYRLLDSVTTNVKQKEACGAYFTVRGAITDETYSTLADICDVEASLE
jgi:RNase P/RNase MRP subunit p29